MDKREKIIPGWNQRARELRRGKKNSITDLRGVRVGHLTVNQNIEDDFGRAAVIRTGMSAVFPYPMEKEMRLFVGCFILGGENEVTGYEVTDDFCYLNSPIAITNSFNVGRVYNAILTYGFSLGRSEIWPPFVIGLNDSYLNDMRRSILDEQDILDAFRHASDGKVEEGSVGIGAGLRAFGWKGGIGTSSRLFDLDHQQFTCGALIASNPGNPQPSQKRGGEPQKTRTGEGSLIIVVGVDVPLVPYEINRIAMSLVVSLPSAFALKTLADSVICVLFSTANQMMMENEGPSEYEFQLIDDSLLETIILACTEAVKEAIFRSLLKSTPVEGRLGRKVETVPEEEFHRLFKEREGVA